MMVHEKVDVGYWLGFDVLDEHIDDYILGWIIRQEDGEVMECTGYCDHCLEKEDKKNNTFVAHKVWLDQNSIDQVGVSIPMKEFQIELIRRRCVECGALQIEGEFYQY